MSDPITISNDTTIMVSFGTILTVAGAMMKLIYNYARMELKAEFQQTSLNEAHKKIRDLEKNREKI